MQSGSKKNIFMFKFRLNVTVSHDHMWYKTLKFMCAGKHTQHRDFTRISWRFTYGLHAHDIAVSSKTS